MVTKKKSLQRGQADFGDYIISQTLELTAFSILLWRKAAGGLAWQLPMAEGCWGSRVVCSVCGAWLREPRALNLGAALRSHSTQLTWGGAPSSSFRFHVLLCSSIIC